MAIAFVLGDRSCDVLDGIKDCMARNNTVITVVIGAKLSGDATGGLS